jgi:DNA-binding SARP family transcriptional activator
VPRIELDGISVESDRNKAVALLAYLAMGKGLQSRDSLAALFWPEYDQSHAYANLRRTLWELNNILGEGCGNLSSVQQASWLASRFKG